MSFPQKWESRLFYIDSSHLLIVEIKLILDDDSKKLLLDLILNSKIGSLGTTSNNIPNVSMVSYSVSKDISEFYILISKLALHTQNILENPNVSLMICEPETSSSNPQTLARVSLNGKAELLEVTYKDYEIIKQNYLIKNSKAKLYFSLGDFLLFRIHVKDGRFVAGFGKAFSLQKDELTYLS